MEPRRVYRKLVKRVTSLEIALKKSGWLPLVVATLFLCLFSTLSLIESSRESATNDEVPHIVAGVSYTQTHKLILNPEHPPLLKYLSGLSAQHFTQPNLNLSSKVWKNENEWQIGKHVLYNTPRNDPDKIVFWARLPILALSIALGVVIFVWARAMFGTIAGLAALALYSLDPNMIAYSHLVTFDLGMAFFVTLGSYFLWRGIKNGNTKWFVGLGIAYGLAVTSKVTAVIFVALWPLLLLPSVVNNGRLKLQQLKYYSRRVLLAYTSTLATIWLVYIFAFHSSAFHNLSPLPRFFIDSLKFGFTKSSNKALYVYYSGHTYLNEPWPYVPHLFLVKLPIILIFLFLVGVVITALGISENRRPYKQVGLYVIAPILIIFSIVTVVNNLGVLRYFLVIFPFMFLLAGFTAAQFFKYFSKPVIAILLIVTLGYYAVNLYQFFPNYLTYINEIGGGHINGYKQVAEANIDWGQGLKQLKKYGQRHGSKLSLIYYGQGDPAYYGLNAVYYSTMTANFIAYPRLPELHGEVAISVTSANFLGLSRQDYRINGVKPTDLIEGSYLIYYLP
jgi:hypothetical protein